jgi:histone deacetylase 6
MERGAGASARFVSAAEAMQDDFPMGDGESVLDTIESNGDGLPITVDPSKLGLLSLSHASTGQLPIHSPSKPYSFQRPKSQLSNAFQASRSPDKMEVFSAAPRHRSSPEVRIAPKPRVAALPYATSRTGLVYDPRMRFHAELPNMSSSEDDIHPEDPRRIHSIFEEIRQAGLVGSSGTDDEPNEQFCWRIAIRMATKPEILLIHTKEHYDFVESLQGMLVYDVFKLDVADVVSSDVSTHAETGGPRHGFHLLQSLDVRVCKACSWWCYRSL